MQKKRKGNKQNQRLGKRVPLGTVPSFNCTEEIRVPTYHSTELKSIIKTLDLRKPVSSNPYKKTVSRKSTSKSVKQNPSYQPPKLKSLMKQFKELKMLHENERSKSKSPASCKSRSVDRYFPKKFSLRTLGPNPTSEPNLTLKLERTMKQLNETNFFREDDSLIPMRSHSDLPSENRLGEVLITEQDEIIDMSELRQFCSTAVDFKKTETLAFKTFTVFKETMAAIKIQRAWRNHQTRRLVEQYTFLSQHQGPGNRQLSQEPLSGSASSESSQAAENCSPDTSLVEEHENDEVVFYPEHCFSEQEAEAGEEETPDRGKRHTNKIRRHISNLEEEIGSSPSSYEEMVKKMKIEELSKWNQIINIISTCKNDNPQELERLLQKLTEQSQLNKKELEEKTKQVLSSSRKRTGEKQERQEIQPEYEDEQEDKQEQCLLKEGYPEVHILIHNRNQSLSSQGLEEYDSRKYIEYLDGDVFIPEQKHVGLKKSQNSIEHSKISPHQQEVLLQNLETRQLPAQLGEGSLYHSESLKGLLVEENRPLSRQSHKRTTSEKTLRKFLSQRSEHSCQEEDDGEINLELLTREFLEGTDPLSDNLDMVYSEEKLRSKLAELKGFKDEPEEGKEYVVGEDYNLDTFIYERGTETDSHYLQRSRPVAQLHQKSVKQEIRIQEGEESPVKTEMEMEEEDLQSDSDEVISEEEGEKLQTVSTIIMNNLVLEVLREIATSDCMTSAFKNYSLSLKPKVRKAEAGKKKKGFPTSKAEIELFLEGLIKYLHREEQGVFKNLEVPTGPSALEMLRYMHQYGQESVEEEEEQDGEEDESNVMVIPNRVFDAFWSLKEKSIIIEIPDNYDQGNSVVFKHQFELLKSFNKIFYRSLFDTFNECLDCERNYGQYGRPFPWKQGPVFDHCKTPLRISNSISSARKKMTDLSTTYCGLIVEKDEMASMSEEYIQQVHEDRLSRMLAGDLVEGQERWVFYDDEETEILVQISNAVYTQVLIEVIESLFEFF